MKYGTGRVHGLDFGFLKYPGGGGLTGTVGVAEIETESGIENNKVGILLEVRIVVVPFDFLGVKFFDLIGFEIKDGNGL